jgi:hypothetical protein
LKVFFYISILLFVKITYAQTPKVIYVIDINDADTNSSVAMPIVLFDNNKYKEPPIFLFDNYTKKEKSNATKTVTQALPFIQKGTSIYFIKNNKVADSCKSFRSKEYGVGYFMIPSAITKNANKFNIATNFILTNKQKLAPKIKPNIKDIKSPEEKVLVRKLLAQIDIDQDEQAEYIYECSVYEGTYFEIYSFKNYKWKKVYTGTYFGL